MRERGPAPAIDHEVPAQLGGVGHGPLQSPAAEQRAEIERHRSRREPDASRTRPRETVGRVGRARLVDKDRPAGFDGGGEALGASLTFERDEQDLGSQSMNLVPPAPQLRHVLAAGQSAQMAEEHDQETAGRDRTVGVKKVIVAASSWSADDRACKRGGGIAPAGDVHRHREAGARWGTVRGDLGRGTSTGCSKCIPRPARSGVRRRRPTVPRPPRRRAVGPQDRRRSRTVRDRGRRYTLSR